MEENEKMAVNRDTAPSAQKYANTEQEEFDVNARPVQTMAVASGVIGQGWDAAKSMTPPAGDYPIEFKPTEEAQLIKFIDLEDKIPFASYRQHFLTKAGQRSYICLGNNCPLCKLPQEMGGKAEIKRAFTIVNLTTIPFQRQMIVASSRFFDIIAAAESGRSGPLRSKYWSVTRTGQKQSTNYFMQAVKSTDLQEDWNLDPNVVEQELKAFEEYDISSLRVNSAEALNQIAKEILQAQ